jgi:mono/diheme cytochrome c family protein
VTQTATPTAPPAATPTAPPAATPTATPTAPLSDEEEAAGRAIVANDCLACHSAQLLEQQRLTPQQWEASVKKMQGWGSTVDAEDAPLLARWLAAHAGPAAGPYEPPRLSARAAADELAATPDGAFARGRAATGAGLYRNACAICHGANAHGAAVGTNLADRTILYRAQDFAGVVRQGRNRMPQFALDDAQIGALLAWLRTQ